MWSAYRDMPGFAMWQWQGSDRPVIARFHTAGWVFELFGQSRPVAAQVGWRHFAIEDRLLRLGGDALRDAVMTRRTGGAKTEPAFAQVLELKGDPYAALLTLEALDDAALRRRLHATKKGRRFRQPSCCSDRIEGDQPS